MSSVRHSIGTAILPASEGRVDSGLVELCDFFAARKECGESLVLGTIVRTEGSTYRKAGARILFSESVETSGLLSGGCLEADLRERAARVLRSGKPERAIFDSRTPDDPIWGMGLGCEGVRISRGLSGAGDILISHPGGNLDLMTGTRLSRVIIVPR